MSQRTLLYCALSPQGGIETHILALSQALAAAGADVTVGAKWADPAPLYRQRFSAWGVQMVVAPEPPSLLRRGRWRTLGDLWRTVALFCRLWPGNFDLVALHAGGTAGLLLRWLAAPKGRVTYHEHVSGVGRFLQRRAYRAMLEKCDFVTANSVQDVELLRPVVREVHHLMALTLPPPPAVAVPPRPGTEFRVGFVGNLAASEKGVRRLWDLWATLPPEGCTLHLHGRGEVPGISGLPLPAAVMLHGPFAREQVGEIYAQIDLLVHPAEQESLGLVLIEAMAFGVPFLCSHVGGMVALAEGNPDAAFTATDPASLRESILAMKRRIDAGNILPQRLRARYEAAFGLSSLGRRWLTLYVG